MAWHRLIVFGAAWFMSVCWGVEPDCTSQAGSDDERLTALMAVQNEFDYTSGDFNLLDEAVLARFRELWCDSDYGPGLAEASDANVSLRLRAVQNATFYAQPDWALERHQAVLVEARERGLADHRAVRTLFEAYQAAGRYEAADALHAVFLDADLPKSPELSPPGVARPAGARQVLRVAAESNRLQGEWFTLEGPQLLVVTSPGCGYCRAAAQRLPADEILGPLIRQYSVWLAERSLNNRFDAVAHWNSEYPDVPTLFVDDPEGWPIPSFDATPRFHFVQDGTVVHTLAGWRGGSDALTAIADGFSRLDLLDTSRLPDDAFSYADTATSSASVSGCPEEDEARKRIRARAQITSRADLEAHLAELEGGAQSPLDRFSTEGRKRFIGGIRFRDDGRIIGFGYGELRAQLEPQEIYAVTALFGDQYFYAGRLFDEDLLNEEEQTLRAMLHCEM
jgi:hypothetical protein